MIMINNNDDNGNFSFLLSRQNKLRFYESSVSYPYEKINIRKNLFTNAICAFVIIT